MTDSQPPGMTTTLVEAFAAVVAAHPRRTAVKCGDRSLTYAELDRRSSCLAARLAEVPGTLERPVGILLDRSVEMVVAAVAVLKAGSCYLPLDPGAPAARNALILEDAAPAAVVTSGWLVAAVPQGAVPVRADGPELREATGFGPVPVSPDARAYVIYTSGTTGRPKGVEVSHRNVLRLFTATESLFAFDRHDVWTVFHSFAFDFSVWEIWGALLFGGCAVVVPEEVAKDPAAFRRLLEREGVTVLNQTPSAFQHFVVEDTRHEGLLPLRYVVFGGEALRFPELRAWTAKNPLGSPVLVNMYGITETTVHASYHQVREADLRAGESVIGRPLPDLDLLLLDEALQPVRAGEPGEIVVVGPGVSLGYLGQPGLTARRFVDVVDRAGRTVRGYRSGDLAREREDGLLVYRGRADDQVKIRGYRIELGEVEAALASHPAVRQAAAVVRESRAGGAVLTAHVVPEPGTEPDGAALRRHLAELVPHYMVPAAVGVLDELPLTGNGKLDRAALPDVAAPAPAAAEAPRSRTEAVLCGLFAELLERDAVGVDEDFFEAGGHSLLAISLQNRVRAAFQSPRYGALPLSQVYRTPTAEGIATWLERSAPAPAAPVPGAGGPV
ncbi:amino acid adenylation domain-containing protein, partial [Kitasatospora sp. NPDC047058]|uniref:amino acid adenylation domain-containing protein n=1 Tax=Kitasatospora sp. NPDC047058 TaxID=3155620 RepID=UPI0033C5847C